MIDDSEVTKSIKEWEEAHQAYNDLLRTYFPAFSSTPPNDIPSITEQVLEDLKAAEQRENEAQARMDAALFP